MIVERKQVAPRPNNLFPPSQNNIIDTNSMIYERGDHSQFSNPLSGNITPNEQSDFSIMPIEQGQLKTMNYSELT